MLRLRDNVALKEDEIQILSYDKVLWKCQTTALIESVGVEKCAAGNIDEVIEKCVAGSVDKTSNQTIYRTLIDKVVELCQNHYDTIINKHLVKMLLDQLEEFYPGVVKGLVPEQISYLQVERKLQEVLRQKGNIRDMIHILEEMEEQIPGK